MRDSARFKRIGVILVAALFMFTITIGAGIYAQDWGQAEIIHFWVATPAGNVTEAMTLRGAGPPVPLSPIIVDLDQRGFLKNWIQPNVEALSTHWIYNLGKRPYTIRMELVNLTLPVKWEVRADYPYDEATRTFNQPLPPGSSIPNLGIDWVFNIPANFTNRDHSLEQPLVIYDGGLKLTDANTGALLTFIPIIIGRGVGASSIGGGCH